MTNFLKRMKNIWKLGEVEIKEGKIVPTILENEKPRMAQIIKMKSEETIINETLQKENV